MPATIYYVRTDGLDSHAGTGYQAANAFLTIAKALSVVAAGDTIRVASGTYREILAPSTAGTNGNQITIVGDVNSQWFLDVAPGPVRITGCDVNETPTANNHLVNLKNYHTLHDLVVDGMQNVPGNTNYSGIYSNGITGTILTRVTVYSARIGVYGHSTTIINNCNINAQYMGIYTGGLVYNSLINSAVYGIITNVTAYSSLIWASSVGCYNSHAYNNTIFNAQYGCQTTGTTVYTFKNNITAFCQTGFYGDSRNMALTKNLTYHCSTGYNGANASYSLDISTCKALYCYALSTGTVTGTPAQAKHIGYNSVYKIMKLANALKFDLFNEKGWSDDTVSWSPYDTYDLGLGVRRKGDGTIDCGCMEYDTITRDYTNQKTTTPCLLYATKAEKIYWLSVKSGVAMSFTVSVKWDLNGGSLKPQLIATALDGCINTQTTTASGTGGAYEDLTVSFTPSYDGNVQLRLYFPETTAGSTCYFSDLKY